jgi:hypothetical protein
MSPPQPKDRWSWTRNPVKRGWIFVIVALHENPVAPNTTLWKSFGRRIDFKLADESLLGIEELHSQISLLGALCPILRGSFHRYDPGRGAERSDF